MSEHRSMKPKMGYKRRMEHDDALWLIWSNKWACWYREKSQGYTMDPLQAGLFSRDEAMKHHNLNEPRAHRVTEPFPISVIRKEAAKIVAKVKAELVIAEQRLALATSRSQHEGASS